MSPDGKYKLTAIIFVAILICSIIKSIILSFKFGWGVLSWTTLEISMLIMSGPISAFFMWPERHLNDSWIILLALTVLFASMASAHIWIKHKWSAFIAIVGGIAWFLSGIFCTLLFSS